MGNTITVDTSTASGDSHAKKVLDALEAVIEGRASKSQTMQMIGGVQVQHIPLEQLVRLRDKYAAKYRTEQVRAGEVTSNRKIKVRFV